MSYQHLATFTTITLLSLIGTASEEDSRFFEIERSSDGVNFEMIGLVDAAGNSTSDKYYSFRIPNLLNKTITA
ncbi:MAG: hypothetical protein IPL12_04265 [Bacteroidetes bacterium]|nr:hypothetical protein [Bacteroidota bacterium]